MFQRIALLVVFASGLAGAVNYSYDDAGRLTKVDYGAAGSISYTYDNAGNVLSRTVQAGAAGASVITSAEFVRSTDGEASIEIRGTNLAAKDATVTIGGKPARILSQETYQMIVLAPDLVKAGEAAIVVTIGGQSSRPFAVRITAGKTN